MSFAYARSVMYNARGSIKLCISEPFMLNLIIKMFLFLVCNEYFFLDYLLGLGFKLLWRRKLVSKRKLLNIGSRKEKTLF